MKNKKNEPVVKSELQHLLSSYKDLLVQGLIAEGVISRIKKEGADIEPSYELSTLAQNNLPNEKIDENNLSQFNNYILLATNIYRNLLSNDTEPLNDVPFSEIIIWLKNNDLIESTLASSIKVDAVDEQAFKDQIISSIKSGKVHFNSNIYRLLEYFTYEIVRRYFNSLNFFFGERISRSSVQNRVVDIIGKNEFDGPDVLFEIKYRRNLFSGLKEGLFQAYEILNAYQKANSKASFIVLLIYTDENSTAFERSKDRFSELVKELFPEYSPKILFIPASLKELNKIKNEFEFIQEIVSNPRSLFIIRFDFMVGKWRNEWNTSGENAGSELIEIRGNGGYIRNKEHIFNIENFNYDYKSNQVSFIKASARSATIDSRRLQNALTLVNDNLLVGTEYNIVDGPESSYNIRYTRVIE